MRYNKKKLYAFYIKNQLIINSLYNNNMLIINPCYSRLKYKIAAVPGNDTIPHEVDLQYCKELTEDFILQLQDDVGLNLINYAFIAGRTGTGICGFKAINDKNKKYLAEAYLYGIDNFDTHMLNVKNTVEDKPDYTAYEQIQEHLNFIESIYYILCLFIHEQFGNYRNIAKKMQLCNKNCNLIPTINNTLLDFINDNGIMLEGSLQQSWLG